MTNHSLRVAIVGGGIGGLTLGLALREHGVNATFVGHPLFDSMPQRREIEGPKFPDRPPVIGGSAVRPIRGRSA